MKLFRGRDRPRQGWTRGKTWVTSFNLRSKLEQKGQKGKTDPIFLLLSKSERREKEEIQELPSKIYGIVSVELCRAKDESSSDRRGLRVGTENAVFLQGSKRGVWKIKGFRFRKCPRGFLGFLLRSKS